MTIPPFTPGEPYEIPPGIRILLVEDNEAASKGLAKLLEVRGFAVTAVQDGKSALDELAKDEPPHFVLTDLQLPDLDGREIARHARVLHPPPRVVLITGWDLDPEDASYERHGIDRVFLKPINVHELVSLLREPRHPDQTGPEAS